MSEFDLIKDKIDGYRDEMIELETLLSSIPAIAPESGGDGETKKCAALKEWLLKAGFKESQFSMYEAKDSRVSSGVRPNMILTIPGKNDDFSIWVMAHMDVVPPGDLKLWSGDPFTVRYDKKTDRLIGRGVEDNQQGLTAGVFAALALLRNNITPEHTVKLLFMADEEFGSEYGIKYLVREHSDLFKKEDLILIPDGGDSKGETIEIAEKNILWMRLHTIGKQCHGSTPDMGKNAHLAACALALELHDLENHFSDRDNLFEPDYSTFQPTKHEANVQTVNIIPGDDVFYMDCRILPRYTLDIIRQEAKKRIAKIESAYGVKIEYSEAQAAESPATDKNAPVVKRLADAIKQAHGITARTIGIGGGTVGAELRCKGYSCAIWSTLDEVCHQPDEYCYVRNIVRDVQTLTALFLQE